MRPVRKQRSWRRAWLGMAALAVLAYSALLVLDTAFHPWARSFTGQPTLTGEWLGTLKTATGRHLVVWLELKHPVGRGTCGNCPRIDGTARTCEAGQPPFDYEVWGNVEDWRGERFALKTLLVGEERVLSLGYLQGSWQADSMALSTELKVPGQVTTTRWEKAEDGTERTSVIGGDPDTRAPVQWPMQRGTADEFAARCDNRRHEKEKSQLRPRDERRSGEGENGEGLVRLVRVAR